MDEMLKLIKTKLKELGVEDRVKVEPLSEAIPGYQIVCLVDDEGSSSAVKVRESIYKSLSTSGYSVSVWIYIVFVRPKGCTVMDFVSEEVRQFCLKIEKDEATGVETVQFDTKSMYEHVRKKYEEADK